MTQPLLERCGALTVIELDRDLAARWRQRPGVTVVESDVLRVDFAALADAAGAPLRVVGNLPYNISTPILFHLLAVAPRVVDQHFMLQKEVVDRMAAEPGSKIYGRLSVMLQAVCEVIPLFDVPPQSFNPPPKVDSAVVRLIPRDPAQVGIRDAVMFAAVVRDAFGQRRKTLRNALSRLCTGEQLQAAGIKPETRAEQLPVSSFVHLANFLSDAPA
jgi:16S rRNA (adenine1518-N6/adenine1519-N6)-dimethyltransferase